MFSFDSDTQIYIAHIVDEFTRSAHCTPFYRVRCRILLSVGSAALASFSYWLVRCNTLSNAIYRKPDRIRMAHAVHWIEKIQTQVNFLLATMTDRWLMKNENKNKNNFVWKRRIARKPIGWSSQINCVCILFSLFCCRQTNQQQIVNNFALIQKKTPFACDTFRGNQLVKTICIRRHMKCV